LLLHALDSVKKQSIKSEILVVIDGDCYNEHQLSTIEKMSDIVFRINPGDGDKHVAVALNTALDGTRCEYVSYLGDDNFYVDEHRLETAVKWLDDNREYIAYVDQARWMRNDGLVVPQEYIGKYQYRRPYLDGHNRLMIDVATSGMNFLVHDCVVHRNVDLRYKTSLRYNNIVCPIDWDYWCRMVNIGKFFCSDAVGVEAFMPGVWRSGFVEQTAIAVRSRSMGKMARNITGKTQVISNAGSGKKFDVPDNGLIDEEFVTTNSGMLFPGFVIDYDNTPKVRISKKDDEPVVEEQRITMDALNSMSYTDLLRTAEFVDARPVMLDEDIVKKSIMDKINGVDKKEYMRPDLESVDGIEGTGDNSSR
jgi:hypothetical protein